MREERTFHMITSPASDEELDRGGVRGIWPCGGVRVCRAAGRAERRRRRSSRRASGRWDRWECSCGRATRPGARVCAWSQRCPDRCVGRADRRPSQRAGRAGVCAPRAGRFLGASPPGGSRVSRARKSAQSSVIAAQIRDKNLPTESGLPIVGLAGLLGLARWRGLLTGQGRAPTEQTVAAGDSATAGDDRLDPTKRAQHSRMDSAARSQPTSPGRDAGRDGTAAERRKGGRR